MPTAEIIFPKTQAKRPSAHSHEGQLISQLALTQKERQLLETLRANPGVCLSRDYLLRHVWGYSQGVRTRTVDVHVQRLRKKLGPELGRRIKTIFKGGYLWQEIPDSEVKL